MARDEYDSGHTANYHKVLDFYQDSCIDDVIKDFFETDPSIKNENSLTIRYQKFDQKTENEKVAVEIRKTVIRLRNALGILDSRTITNIGARVFYYIIPQEIDPIVYFQPTPILIQVWQGRSL